MRNNLIIIFLAFSVIIKSLVFAGNAERTGQAGATQLLVNPYARCSGLNGINVSEAYGIESAITNIAGLAHTQKTEIVFAHTIWFANADIRINSLGISQRLGENGGVLGFSVVAFNFGDIPITTIDQPDGGLGTFSPTFLNLGVSYAREMVADRIFVGFTVKLIHESIPNVSANGIALDGGVQYRSKSINNKPGKFRMGVAIRNVGPEMRYTGDGLSFRVNDGSGAAFDTKASTVAAKFEIPTVFLIGASYRMTMGDRDSSIYSDHTITPMATFVSNSFQKDQLGIGVEYAFKQMLMVRASYLYEDKILDKEETTNAYTGLSGGVSVELPFGKKDQANGGRRSSFGVDYSFRPARFLGSTHSIGLRINL